MLHKKEEQKGSIVCNINEIGCNLTSDQAPIMLRKTENQRF
jgi:hypothetical protein